MLFPGLTLPTNINNTIADKKIFKDSFDICLFFKVGKNVSAEIYVLCTFYILIPMFTYDISPGNEQLVHM